MGVTVRLCTYFGIEAPREVFWIATGEQLVCGRDLRHTITANAKFCPECGLETKLITIEAPSPRFAEMCAKSGLDPVKFFGLLSGDTLEEGWAWEDDGEGGSGRSFSLRWLNVAAIDGDAGYSPKLMALAFTLHSVYTHTSDPPPRVAASWSEMEIYDRAMREVAKIFGIEGEPRLYSQVFYG
jgi:hypothetical protein